MKTIYVGHPVPGLLLSTAEPEHSLQLHVSALSCLCSSVPPSNLVSGTTCNLMYTSEQENITTIQLLR